jgi:glutamyl-tRNA reductase
MPVVVVGLSHHTAPLPVRELFAFADGEIPSVLRKLRESGLAEEAVILSTCNRVELYAVTAHEPSKAFRLLREFLCESRSYLSPLEREIYGYGEPQSFEHLFKVACGLDSMVLGETEILGQLKRAYQLAFEHHYTGSVLNRVFQRAFNTAKLIRSCTNIQRGSMSVGSVAVQLAEKIFDALRDRQVLVIGAGDTSEKTARALLSRGAGSILVANRSFERAVALARELGGRAVSFERWGDELGEIDIVISSTSAPGYILDRQKLEPLLRRRGNRPLLLIDIAVPRDIEPEVSMLDNVYLYNIDDLQSIVGDTLRQRQQEIARCERVIREKTKALLDSLANTGVSPRSRPAPGPA